ncbi:hypothetical protein EV356DRAFT_495637 [Viridothelium virens]|uniref:Uncharacterized protein n=1 Tax=Viridothelium virens TaxID=1048519 RepID=A0A6A6HQX0_VIRVR|nr:hypothetical protein EV356DRAFT_495637 [Viridothelium virens]
MPDIQTGSSQTLAPSSDILSTAGTSTTDNANSDNSGRYANASNLSTIIGTAVGIPVGLLTVIVTVYFGCKELRTKMRRDQRGSELSLVSVHGHS